MPKKKISVRRKKSNGASIKIKQLSNQITKLLDQAKIKYKVLEHKVVYTAHDAARTTKRKLGEIAKVVLVKADSGWALIVVPAGKYIDLKGIKKALKAKKVSIANEKDITKHLKTTPSFDGVPGRMTGQSRKPAMLLHPFGHLYKIPTLIDKGMAKAKKMIASAGSYTHSVELALKDFEKLVKPIKGAFSKAKK